MTGRPGRIRSPAFWAKVAPAAIGGEKTLASLAGPFDVRPSRNEPRPLPLRVGASGVFGVVAASEVAADVEARTLHATIGELTPSIRLDRRAGRRLPRVASPSTRIARSSLSAAQRRDDPVRFAETAEIAFRPSRQERPTRRSRRRQSSEPDRERRI